MSDDVPSPFTLHYRRLCNTKAASVPLFYEGVLEEKNRM
jgi:hypothetical protein